MDDNDVFYTAPTYIIYTHILYYYYYILSVCLIKAHTIKRLTYIPTDIIIIKIIMIIK